MVYMVCVIRDQKSEAFGRPIFTISKGVAIRSFDDEVNRADPDNEMFKHAEDFSLYYLGTYADHDGKFTTGIPQLLIQGDQVKKGQLQVIPDEKTKRAIKELGISAV